MLDLLLAYPFYPNDTFYHLIFDWHLGAGYILAYLKKEGILADCFVRQTPASLHDIVRQILERNPKIVGFTCYDVNYYFVKLISRALKNDRKDITVIIGGPSATFSDKFILNDESSIDVCVRGEGEQTTFELIQCLKTGENLKSIRGISFRENGSIIRTTDRPLLVEPDKNSGLDIFPSPYLNGIFPAGLNRGILTSRGCIYHCIYCNFAAMSRWTVRFHSMKRIMSELAHIAENDPYGAIFIYDDNFSLNKKRAKEICQHIVEEKLALQFGCLSRTENLDNELLKLMQRANFKHISVGLESSIPKNLRSINKVTDDRRYSWNLSPEKKFIRRIKNLSNKMRKLGLNLEISIITGLPDQSQKEAEQTVDFVDALQPFQCYHDFLTIYPGTSLFRLRKKFGLDVIPSKTGLPFKTRFAFDVNKVRLSRYALPNYRLKGSLIRLSKKIFSRIPHHPQEGSDVPEIFFHRGSFHLSTFITENRLKNNLTLSPVSMLMGESEKYARKELYRLIEDGMPLMQLLILERLQNKALGFNDNYLHIYKLIFLTEVIERRRLPSQELALFFFIPLSRLNSEVLAKVRNFKNNKHDRRIIMISLNNQEDKVAFSGLLSNSAISRNISEGTGVELDMTEACRWINSLCPAITENSLYVNKNGEVSSCNKGIYFKMQNENIDLKNEFSKDKKQILLEQVEKKRGCQSCEVTKNCSKCLYTYPYSEKEFCELKKKEDTVKLIKLLKAYNAFEFLTHHKNLRNKNESSCKK